MQNISQEKGGLMIKGEMLFKMKFK